MHHAVGELLGAMQGKARFLEDLRRVTGFFKYQGLRERFQHFCLVGQHQRNRVLFNEFPATFIEWRWGSLVVCIRHLLLIQPVLVTCWDTARMVAKGTHVREQSGRDDGDFQKSDNVQEVGRVINDQRFWAYGQMLVYLADAADSLVSWCQTCPCHPTPVVRKACRIMEDVGSSDQTKRSCPFLGCRAACMANGHWKRFLQHVFNACAGDIIGLTVGMTTDARDILLTDWAKGQEVLLLGLQLRFQFFANLPHRLLGMSAIDRHEAQTAAAESLRLWEAAEDKSKQHPVSKLLLEDDQLREAIAKLAAGCPLADLPALQAIVLPWRFGSIIERPIEALHSISGKKLAHASRPSPPSVSLALRSVEIESDMLDESFLLGLADRFGFNKQPALLIGNLGLANHPTLCFRIQTYGSVRLRDVTKVFYHCDSDTGFLSHSAVVKELKGRRKAGKGKQKKAETICEGTPVVVPDGHRLLRDSAHAHFQAQDYVCLDVKVWIRGWGG